MIVPLPCQLQFTKTSMDHSYIECFIPMLSIRSIAIFIFPLLQGANSQREINRDLYKRRGVKTTILRWICDSIILPTTFIIVFRHPAMKNTCRFTIGRGQILVVSVYRITNLLLAWQVFALLNKEQIVQVCDATMKNSSNTAEPTNLLHYLSRTRDSYAALSIIRYFNYIGYPRAFLEMLY
jgi:hypothetical protein